MRARRFPPGPSMLAAMRGLRDMNGGRDLAGVAAFFSSVAEQYGSVAHWTMVGRHFYLLDDPALIEETLVLKARDFRKGRGIARLKRLLGNGLIASEEPLHLRQRRLLQPAFHTERIAGYGDVMVAATREHVAGWQPGSLLEIDREMNHLTLSIAARMLFSSNISEQSVAIRSALTTALRAFPASLSRLSELLDALPMLPVTRRFNRARAELDAVIYGIIAARRNDETAKNDDLLAMLLGARDADGAMDDAQVRDEAMTLFIAGHETTANALAWTWYLLARNPTTAARLREELDSVLGGRPPRAADLPRLRFTHDVFAEALRLYPPAWALGRRALRDTTIGDFSIPRGSVVIVSPLVTQRNARYWDDPAEFMPERWPGNTAPRFAYFPFGGGVRRCIGESFAWMEGVLLIATIGQKFDLSAVDAESVDTEPLVTLRPRSAIRMRITPRAADLMLG